MGKVGRASALSYRSRSKTPSIRRLGDAQQGPGTPGACRFGCGCTEAACGRPSRRNRQACTLAIALPPIRKRGTCAAATRPRLIPVRRCPFHALECALRFTQTNHGPMFPRPTPFLRYWWPGKSIAPPVLRCVIAKNIGSRVHRQGSYFSVVRVKTTIYHPADFKCFGGAIAGPRVFFIFW